MMFKGKIRKLYRLSISIGFLSVFFTTALYGQNTDSLPTPVPDSLIKLWDKTTVFPHPELKVSPFNFAFSGEVKIPRAIVLLNDHVFNPKKFLNINPENYIENFSHEAYVQNETAGDFSRPDDYSISINGASFKWNRYYWNDLAIHSLSNPGASLHKIDLNRGWMTLNTSELSLNFRDDVYPDSAFVRVRGNISPFFGLMPNASGIASGITGHGSSFDRKVKDFDYRRHTDHQFSVYLYNPTSDGKGYSQVYLNKGKRFHTAFDQTGLIGEFPEDYLQMNASFARRLKNKWFSDWFTMISYKGRDAYQAEWNYEQAETGTEHQWAISSFLKSNNNDGYDFNVGLNVGLRSVDKDQNFFYRNMYDIDGEGFEPLYPLASYLEVNPVFNYNRYFRYSKNAILRNTKLSARFENGLVHFNPNQEHQQAYYYFDPLEGESDGLYEYNLNSKSFSSFIAHDRLDLEWADSFGKSTLWAGVSGVYSGVWSPNVAIWDMSMDMHIRWEYKLRNNISIGIGLEKRSMPLNYSLVQYLENNYLDGSQNVWNDNNSDGIFEDSERGGLFKNYGGSNRSYSSKLKMNKQFALDIPVKWQMTGKSRLELIGRFRSFRDLWWTQFSDSPENYGHFETIGEDEIFFFDESDVHYELQPFDVSLMTDNIENDHWLFEYPFYAGATLGYFYEGESTFIKTSFTAYEVVGPGTLGNGAQANSLGLMTDYMANPNANIHLLGRLNPDRSYLFSFMIGKKLNENFKYAVIVNYKDGQSFNGYSTALRNDQLAIWNHGIPGDNPFTGEFNKREDGFWNVEFRAEYATKFKNRDLVLHAEIYNLIDLGWEINEYTYQPYIADSRPALDIQIPRGLIFGLDLSL